MLSEGDMERIHTEAHAAAVVDEAINRPFAAGPMIHELRGLIDELPTHATLHLLLGFCLKRIEDFEGARGSLAIAEFLMRRRGCVDLADRVQSFIDRLGTKA